jgi:hypothetical protein
MAKQTRRRTDNVLPMPPSERAISAGSTDPADGAIARRAFELYCERGYQHRHDVDDWLQAEREILLAEPAIA